MKLILLLQLLVSASYSSDGDWQSLDNCVQKLKNIETEVSASLPLRTLIPLDRRLDFMLDGIRYAEMNSNLLKDFVGSDRSDKRAPYLITNALGSCEADELKLTRYLGQLKRFLLFFCITTLSISLYGVFLFAHLVHPPATDKSERKHFSKREAG